MKVALWPTMHIHEGFEQCNEAEADQFSVYLGEPGDFLWTADFAHYTDARNWAEEVADCHECELIDYVEKERRIKIAR